MFVVACVFFGLALIAYAGALCFMGSVVAEILSDVGNAIMLGTTVLLLLRLTKKQMKHEPPDKESIEPT